MNRFMECGGRMKWRCRPAYSVIAVVFDHSGRAQNRRGGVAARRTRSALNFIRFTVSNNRLCAPKGPKSPAQGRVSPRTSPWGTE
jgi:hypothetical protein